MYRKSGWRLLWCVSDAIKSTKGKGKEEMTTDKVKEVQEYLKKKGFKVAETTIIDMAIDLTRRLGADDWTFACEAKMREEIKEREKEEVKDDIVR
jgi:hypothetical protein